MKTKKEKERTPYWLHTDKSEADLRDQFIALLDEDHLEQVYQRYIEKNTRLIPREFIQNHGIHFKLVLRKLAFGADYKSDFVYLSKSSDDWNAVLVELEAPRAKFFREEQTSFIRNLTKLLNR
jgi:hypothetical protein